MNELEKVFDAASSDVFPTLDVVVEGCDDAYNTLNTYGKTCVQAQVLSNNILRDYELNCKQIRLKCYTEDGTEDDFCFYEEKARNGAVGQLKKILDKIVMLWQDIVRKIKAIITTKICSTTARTAVKKMKKTLDANPKLKTIKVKAPSITTALGVIEGFRRKCNLENTQYVKTLTGVKQVKSIGGLVEDFNKSFGRAIVGKAAVCTLTLAGLIIAIEAEMDKLPSVLEEVDLRETTIIRRLGATVSEDVEVGAAAAFQQAANFRVQLGKQELETHCQYLHNMVQTAKDSISQALTGKAPILVEDADNERETRMLTVDEYFGQDESFDESVAFEGYDFDNPDETFDEGANLDARRIFKAFDKETTELGKEISKLNKLGAYSEASKKCDELIKLMDTAESQILALNVTPGSIAFGIVVQYLVSMCKVALSTLLVVCAGVAGGAVGGIIGSLVTRSPARLAATVGITVGTGVAAIPVQLMHFVSSLVEIVTMLTNLIVTIKKRRPDGTSFAAADLYINTFIGAISRSRATIVQVKKDCDEKASGKIVEDADQDWEEEAGMDVPDINAILDSLM